MLFDDYITELKNSDKIEGVEDKENLIYNSKLMFDNLIKVGFTDKYIYDYNNDKIEEIMLKLKPKNTKVLATYYTLLSRFLEWCIENNCLSENNYKDFSNIDKRKSYNKIKNKNIPMISYREYKQVIDDIERVDNNATYLSALYMCLYEGIYTKRLYSLEHLRLKDIDKANDLVKFKYNNGKENSIKVSKELISKLIELGNNNKWYRRNRFNSFEVIISGLYEDSIFKTEERKNKNKDSKSNAFESAYNVKLKYINENYLGRKISAYDIFKSGITYRISVIAKREGVDIKNYYSDKYDKSIINNILETELKRVNLDMIPKDYMNLIRDYLDMF